MPDYTVLSFPSLVRILDTTAMKTAGPIFSLIVFGAFFAALTWFLEVPCVQVLLRQYHAESFPKTQGQIISADVYTTTGSKGSIFYHPRIVYTYSVAGHDYTARRYRYDGQPSDEASVDHIVYEHPAGSTVDVYYDPNKPAAAVLSTRVVAHDVSILFLLVPYNLMLLYCLVITSRRISWPGTSELVAGGVKILSDQMTTRVRLPRFRPSSLGLLVAGILSLVAGIAIQVSETTSPVPLSLQALLAIAAAGGAVYAWQYRKIVSGRQDLVINFGSRTVELPLTYKRRERRPLPFSTITAVTVEKVAHRTRSSVRYTYAPTLRMQDGTTERLTDLNEDRAGSFAAWLREKLGVPA
jgi:hypothetical protein